MKTKYTLIALAAASTLSQLPAFAADEADIQRAIEYVKQHEKDGSVKTNGLGLISADGESSVNITGMVHFDAHSVDSGLPCLLYTSPSPRDRTRSRMPSSA